MNRRGFLGTLASGALATLMPLEFLRHEPSRLDRLYRFGRMNKDQLMKCHLGLMGHRPGEEQQLVKLVPIRDIQLYDRTNLVFNCEPWYCIEEKILTSGMKLIDDEGYILKEFKWNCGYNVELIEGDSLIPTYSLPNYNYLRDYRPKELVFGGELITKNTKAELYNVNPTS